jgi:hypothetical protein
VAQPSDFTPHSLPPKLNTGPIEPMRDVPVWFAGWLPALVYPCMLLAIPLYPPFYGFLQRKEGAVEYCAVVVLLVGVFIGLGIFKYINRLPRGGRWLKWFYSISLLGMLVFAGEEVSWGQHFGLWGHEDVPQFIAEHNDQTETNFHNMSNVLDQGPTNLIVLGTFLAFVILPIVRKTRGLTMRPDHADYWFWPTRVCVVSAIGVLLIPFPKRIYEWITVASAPNELRHSEFHEFYIALLMTTYIISVYLRLRQMPEPTVLS